MHGNLFLTRSLARSCFGVLAAAALVVLFAACGSTSGSSSSTASTSTPQNTTPTSSGGRGGGHAAPAAPHPPAHLLRAPQQGRGERVAPRPPGVGSTVPPVHDRTT